MASSSDGPLPLKLRDMPAAQARPALPLPGAAAASDEQATSVEPRGPADDGPRSVPAPRERFGHYVILQTIGEGAMGVVLAAYDQHLDRKVALKLLRADVDDDEGVHHRMRREAQAMARLSHPNVVQVYESGEIDGHLFLAMEFVQGQTLRSWTLVRQRAWRDVLAVFVQAGQGLAAAHAAGLTHRDFKPDNVMVGVDGRVRVLDFGLSRGRSGGSRSQLVITRKNLADVGVTAAGSMLGTPAYMSPEQFRGDEADARSDQFGFCAAVWEGLYGRRPFHGADVRELRARVLAGEMVPPPAGTRVPNRLRKILERGLSLAPGDRWPGMDALLAALAHDPQAARRRWALAGLAALAVGAAGYAVAAYRAADAHACDDAAAELAGVWDEPQRAAVDAAVRATGVAYADTVLAATVDHLDRYRDDLVAAHTDACEVHRRRGMSDSLYDRRVLCLRQRRAELAATIDVVQHTTIDSVARVAATAAGLPPIAACADDERLMADLPPPADPAVAAAVLAVRERLAHARALARSQRFHDALAVVAPLSAEAERLADPGLHAEVLLLHGGLHGETLHNDEALAPLARAEVLAIEARADRVAAAALSEWIYNTGFGVGRTAEALAAGPRAWAHVRRAGSPPLLVADLYNSLATVRFEQGDVDASLGEYEAALALLGREAPDDPVRSKVIHNLVLTWNSSGRHAQARTLAHAELTRLTASLGACHPDTATLRIAVAMAENGEGRIDEAVAAAEQSFVCLVESAPQPALRTLSLLIGLAFQRNDVAEARRQLARADPLLARVSDDPALRVTFDMYRAQIAIQDGRTAEAGALLVALAEQLADGPKEYRALVENMRGKLALAEGDPPRAIRHATLANQLLPPSAPPQYRAQLRFNHARALRAVDDRGGAVAVAEDAIRDFEAAGPGFAAKIAEIRAWLAEP